MTEHPLIGPSAHPVPRGPAKTPFMLPIRTASGNTDNYGSIVAGNDTGPIGTAALATSPWANIAF